MFSACAFSRVYLVPGARHRQSEQLATVFWLRLRLKKLTPKLKSCFPKKERAKARNFRSQVTDKSMNRGQAFRVPSDDLNLLKERIGCPPCLPCESGWSLKRLTSVERMRAAVRYSYSLDPVPRRRTSKDT